MFEQVQQVAATAGGAQRRQSEGGQDLAHLVGDVEQVLRQRPRITFEHLGVGGEAGGALDVAVLAMTHLSIISAVVPNS